MEKDEKTVVVNCQFSGTGYNKYITFDVRSNTWFSDKNRGMSYSKVTETQQQNNCTGKKGCPRCEGVPEGIQAPGKLYMWFAIGHTHGKFRNFAKEYGYEFDYLDDSRLNVVVKVKENLDGFVDCVRSLFSSTELKDTRTIFLEGEDAELSVSDFPLMRSFDEMIAFIRSDWLIDLLKHEHYLSHFHPIVSCNDMNDVFAYECLFRGMNEDGSIVPPVKIFDLARDSAMLFQLDQTARKSAIKSAAQNNIQENIFINFNPVSIYDPDYCLKTTFELLREMGFDSSKIIFEVVESDEITDYDHLLNILNKYRSQGFRIAMDDIGAGYSSLAVLHQLKPDFVKIDRALVQDVHKDEVKSIILSKILEIAQELGIQTVAEGVETQEELDFVREKGADYFQGFLVCKPSEVPWKAAD